MAKCPCAYEKAGCCLKLKAKDAFRENVRDLLFTCGQFLDGKISQEVMLAMIDICKEKMELVSHKTIDKVLKDHKKGK